MSSLRALLSQIPDHRGCSGRKYSFDSIVLLVLAGFMCGCNSISAVARFAASLNLKQREALGFVWWRGRVPSQPTLCIFFHHLDVDALESALMLAAPEGTVLAMDGKRLRGSVSDENPHGVHMLSCFASVLRRVAGQARQKSGNEITAALELLQSLELKGCIVTGDAMFAHRTLCETIRHKGGHYVFTLKDNNKPMKKAVERAFSHKTAGCGKP